MVELEQRVLGGLVRDKGARGGAAPKANRGVWISCSQKWSVTMKTELKEDQRRSAGWIPRPSKLRDGVSINEQSRLNSTEVTMSRRIP